MTVQSYNEIRQVTKIRSLACRVVFLSDLFLSGPISIDDDISFELISEQLEAFSVALVSAILDFYADEANNDY